MKFIRKIFAIVMCLLLIFSVVSGSKKVNAAGKDATNTIEDKGKIKELSNEFRDLLGYYACYSLEVNESELFDFSKKKSRQEAIRYTYEKHGKLTGSAQNKLSKQLFGAGVAKIEQLMGDWGCSCPVLKVAKIYKMPAKRCQVKITIYMVDDDGGREKIGSAIMFVKKNQKAKYGYYVKQIKVLRLI